ncbi:putative F-box/RNI/FBD-like domains-containing protein [Quillaja saponaria]|uniref:F-box/RNI/FBD-like domains-containing protein n=1 Tax=Quillaja saponaria TaxID=32244 RepID=A0AAD7QHU5_QUISA|nr:putative F-box/RNI/FBD-like domains-containing protein [Quillaja saponaria]
MRSSAERSEGNITAIDRLSDLPDSVLCHILSFLPTRLSVATSILSTRWRLLWTLVPNLELDQDLDKSSSFVDVVSRVLILHKAQSIRRCRLICSEYYCKPTHVNTWVSAAVGLNVEELDISYRRSLLVDAGFIGFPSSLFTCKTLVVLKLDSSMPFRVPLCVQLPLLNILHLIRVEFVYDNSLQRFLSGCPALEDLDVDRNVDVNYTCKINVPTLKRLKIRISSVFTKVKIEINTPSLEYLNLSACDCQEFILERLPNLVEANVHVYSGAGYTDEIINLFKGLNNVKFLELSEHITRYLSFDLPQFHNLVSLKISVGSCDEQFLPNLLENCCKLEDLVIEKSGSQSCWAAPKHVPICLSMNFTSFYFGEYQGLKDELELAGYILKHAIHLKTMTIRCAKVWDSDDDDYVDKFGFGEKFCLLKKLSMFPRGSKSCQLSFE